MLGSVPEDVYFPCFPGLSQVDWKKCPTKIHQDNYSRAFFMIVTLFDMNKIVLFCVRGTRTQPLICVVREVFSRLHFRRRRHTFASL